MGLCWLGLPSATDRVWWLPPPSSYVTFMCVADVIHVPPSLTRLLGPEHNICLASAIHCHGLLNFEESLAISLSALHGMSVQRSSM